MFSIASKIERCGDNTCDGCACKQPKKIYKEGLATLIAEWPNKDNIPDENGIVKDKLTMKLTPEIVLKILEELVMMMLNSWVLVQFGLDLIG